MPNLETYASLTSVNQGETITFHASSASPTSVPMRIVRIGIADLVVYTSIEAIGSHAIPPNAGEVGCGWPAFNAFVIPLDWLPGLYRMELGEVNSPDATGAYFVVKAQDAGSTSSILLAFTVTTEQAYNPWPDSSPGQSLYYHDLPTRGRRVSFDRPGGGHYVAEQIAFLRWLYANGYTVECGTSIDLHADAELLTHYQLLLSVGHDEYWSKEMRDHVEGFIGRGGNVAFFSANTCWWQVRFEDDDRTMVCYKNALEDPLTGVENERVTVEWRSDPVGRPENHLTGVSTLNGAGCFFDYTKMADAAYEVRFAEHWVYEGTGLVNGALLGAGEYIVGYETDATEFEVIGGVPRATGRDGTPPSFVVLATADLTDWGSAGNAGWATMGIFRRNGVVFTAGTTDWVSGLNRLGSAVPRITRNVISRLRDRYPAGDWEVIGRADGVVAMAVAEGRLFAATSGNRLQMREITGQNVGWTDVGHANDVIAMASLDSTTLGGVLYVATQDGRIGWRSPVPYEVNWVDTGEVSGVVALAFTNGRLFAATTDNRVRYGESGDWMTGPVAWYDAGHADNVAAMSALNGALFAAARDGRLGWREPVTFEVNWEDIASLANVVALAATAGKLIAVTGDGRLWWRDAVRA